MNTKISHKTLATLVAHSIRHTCFRVQRIRYSKTKLLFEIEDYSLATFKLQTSLLRGIYNLSDAIEKITLNKNSITVHLRTEQIKDLKGKKNKQAIITLDGSVVREVHTGDSFTTKYLLGDKVEVVSITNLIVKVKTSSSSIIGIPINYFKKVCL